VQYKLSRALNGRNDMQENNGIKEEKNTADFPKQGNLRRVLTG
jgi:hypothetical protein